MYVSRLESWLSKEMQFTVASESDIRLTFSGLSKHKREKNASLSSWGARFGVVCSSWRGQ